MKTTVKVSMKSPNTPKLATFTLNQIKKRRGIYQIVNDEVTGVKPRYHDCYFVSVPYSNNEMGITMAVLYICENDVEAMSKDAWDDNIFFENTDVKITFTIE